MRLFPMAGKWVRPPRRLADALMLVSDYCGPPGSGICANPQILGPLLGRLAVELLVGGFRFGAGMVHHTVSMIRRRIERIEL